MAKQPQSVEPFVASRTVVLLALAHIEQAAALLSWNGVVPFVASHTSTVWGETNATQMYGTSAKMNRD